MNIDSILPLLIPVVVITAVIIASVVQSKKSKANLAKLADKLGLKLELQGRVSKEMRVTGERRGRTVSIFSYVTGAGKSRRRWVAVAAHVKDVGQLTFSLKPRIAVFELFLRPFRESEIKVGDAVFDKKWALTSNRPDFMQAALLPEMRERIMRLSSTGLLSAHYELNLYSVQYAEQGSFSNDKLCERFIGLADLVCDLADVLEVGEEMKKSQS